MRDSAKRTFNLTEAGEELGLSASTVRQRILDGQLEAERDGGRWVIYPEAVADYRERRRYRPAGGGGVIRKLRRPPVCDLTAEERAILEEAGIRVR